MTRLQSNHDPEPYENELDHLADEIAWVSARCTTLASRIEAEREVEEVPILVDARAGGEATTDAECKVARLAALEAALRRQIDVQLAATSEAGRMLGLPPPTARRRSSPSPTTSRCSAA